MATRARVALSTPVVRPAPASRRKPFAVERVLSESGHEIDRTPAATFGRGFDFSRVPILPPTQNEADPFAMVQSRGGTVKTGAAVDAVLRAGRARAATIGAQVLLRSDIARRPGSPLARYTLAHEAMHVLQQRGASGTAPSGIGETERAERDADRGAREMLAGREPAVGHHEAGPVARFLLDDADFQPPEPAMPLSTAQADSHWVETDIVDYAVSTRAPWIFTVLYADGQMLEIPLDKMSFQGVGGASITIFRRHRVTGRLVPCRIGQDALRALPAQITQSLTAATIHTVIPARFDPDLTPRIVAYLNEAQMMQLSMGLLGVAGMWAGGGVSRRPPAGLAVGAGTRLAASRSARYIAMREAARRAASQTAGRAVIAASASRIAQVADDLVATTATIQANGPRFIRAATLLSSRAGLTALEKAQVIQEFARRIGFGFSQRGLLDVGAHFLLESEDAVYAFRIMKDTGQIWYGRFSREALTYLWQLLVL
jgi:hypothetical protein